MPDVCRATILKKSVLISTCWTFLQSLLQLDIAVSKRCGAGALMQTTFEPDTAFTACQQSICMYAANACVVSCAELTCMHCCNCQTLIQNDQFANVDIMDVRNRSSKSCEVRPACLRNEDKER